MSVANVETVTTATKSAGIRYVHSDAAALAFTEGVRRAVDSGPQELVDAPADPSELPKVYSCRTFLVKLPPSDAFPLELDPSRFNGCDAEVQQ